MKVNAEVEEHKVEALNVQENIKEQLKNVGKNAVGFPLHATIGCRRIRFSVEL